MSIHTTLQIILLFALSLVEVSSGHGKARAIDYNEVVLTEALVASAPNNSLFERWRPQSHLIAPAGWMNDPCGLMYDPVQDTYHAFYEWHPHHTYWGNASWGHATSKDLVTWEDVTGWEGSEANALTTQGKGTPSFAGIFGGSAQPVNLQGVQDGTLLAMYTAAKTAPIGWDIPYEPHCESQCIALSKDGGRTWAHIEQNPVISTTTETAPMYWNLTGFRDPMLELWPDLDELRGATEPHYYATFGSGIRGVGPRMPLWIAPANDLTNWTFLGALWEPSDNSSFGPLYSTGCYGYGFESAQMSTLKDRRGRIHHFVHMGTEGDNSAHHQSLDWTLWQRGNMSVRVNGSLAFAATSGGVMDAGIAYAVTSFDDTKNDRRVAFAWAPEDLDGQTDPHLGIRIGFGGGYAHSQLGYRGSFTLPRELFFHETDGVYEPDETLRQSRTVEFIPQDGAFVAQTLGIRPLPDVVEALRRGSTHKIYDINASSDLTLLQKRGPSRLELKVTIRRTTGRVGFLVAKSPCGREQTKIIYDPIQHTISVDREHSSELAPVNHAPAWGYFQRFQLQTDTGVARFEDLHLQVFIDGSLIEVYANDRFALTTRIYPTRKSSTGYGIFVDPGVDAEFSRVDAYHDLLKVWPERPANTSSYLVYDTAAETGNYTFWPGY